MNLSPSIAPGAPGFWYLATPFTNYPLGHEQAWLDACRLRGELVRMGISAYSPIAETYGAVKQMNLPVDHIFWKADNESKMIHAYGLIMAELPGWADSEGMDREHKWFLGAKKPIVWCRP
jgi:hypothetical protein